jgi:MFS family permease
MSSQACIRGPAHEVTALSSEQKCPKSPHTLGQKGSFWVSAGVVVHMLWTSAAPAMTYPLYAAQWHVTTTVTTAIFALYPIVVVAVLIAFGDLSDYIGRRLPMLFGLGASLTGVALFAVAPDVSWLFAGRVLMGIGVGLSAGPSASAMVEFSAPGQSGRASSITTAAQALGLACALIVGGGLIQYAPYPTQLNFEVLFGALAMLFVAAWFLPRHTANEAAARWRMKLPVVPQGLGKMFLLSVTAVTSAYSLGSLMMSLGAQMVRELIGSSNTLVNGAAMAIFALVFGVTSIAAKRVQSNQNIVMGGLCSAIGMAFIVVSSSQHTLLMFVIGSALAGSGYSLLFMGGLSLINANTPVHHRGGTLSALFLVAYLTQGVIAQLLGLAATKWGLGIAINLGAMLLGGLGLCSALLATAFRSRDVLTPKSKKCSE